MEKKEERVCGEVTRPCASIQRLKVGDAEPEEAKDPVPEERCDDGEEADAAADAAAAAFNHLLRVDRKPVPAGAPACVLIAEGVVRLLDCDGSGSSAWVAASGSATTGFSPWNPWPNTGEFERNGPGCCCHHN